MEILNIDSLATPATRKVSIAGKQYDVMEMSVQQFIDYSKKAKELEDNPDSAEFEKIENMADMISGMIPDCPKDVLRELRFNQITALFAFCRGVLVDEIMKTYGQNKEEGEPKKGRKPASR